MPAIHSKSNRLNHPCAFCEFSGDRAEILEEHLNREHHLETVDASHWLYACTKINPKIRCPGRFRSWSGLKNHVKNNHGSEKVAGENRLAGEEHRARYRLLVSDEEFNQVKRFNPENKRLGVHQARKEFKSNAIQQKITSKPKNWVPEGVRPGNKGYNCKDYISRNGIVPSGVAELDDPDLAEWISDSEASDFEEPAGFAGFKNPLSLREPTKKPPKPLKKLLYTKAIRDRQSLTTDSGELPCDRGMTWAEVAEVKKVQGEHIRSMIEKRVSVKDMLKYLKELSEMKVYGHF